MSRIDIPQLLDELNQAGVPDSETAARLTVTRSAVSAWHAGDKRPSLDPGIGLLLLHLEFCPASSPLRTRRHVFSKPSHGEFGQVSNLADLTTEQIHRNFHEPED